MIVTSSWVDLNLASEPISMNADFVSPAIEVRGYVLGSVQSCYEDSTSDESFVTIEASLDAEHWCDIFPVSSIENTIVGDGCTFYSMEYISYPYIRFNYQKVAASNTGTFVAIKAFFKKVTGNY